MSDKKRGFFRSLFGSVGSAAKGALGGEFIAGGASLASNAKYALKARTCPRCFERSLFEQEDSTFACVRNDICGWRGTVDDVHVLEAMENNIHPMVYAVAKGMQVDAGKTFRTNKFFSWLLWLVVLGMLLYALYMSIIGSVFLAAWVVAVAFLFSLHAIRFAYRAQFIKGAFSQPPKEFLLYPRQWFVV